MAIVNIKYDLSDRDDAMALQRAMYSLDMAAYIFEILMSAHFRSSISRTSSKTSPRSLITVSTDRSHQSSLALWCRN